MFSSQIRGFLYGVFITTSLVSVITYASGTDGVFGDYFERIITGVSGDGRCPEGEAIIGFSTGSSDFGMPICASHSTSIGGGAGWENIALTDTNDFDENCEYRFKTSNGGYAYADFVQLNALTFEVSTSQFALGRILKSNKSNGFYTEDGDVADVDNNRCSVINCANFAITKLEKKCGGGGSGGSASQKVLKGRATVTFYNGNAESEHSIITFNEACTNPRISVSPVEGSSSIKCSNASVTGIGTCPSYVSDSQDMHAYAFNIDNSGFKVMLSGMDGVWVGATSPVYPIDWIAVCDEKVGSSGGESDGTPIGTISAFNSTTCPTGWIPADGTNGTPDLRGEFIRGWDNGRGVDAGRVLGSGQKGSIVGFDTNSDGTLGPWAIASKSMNGTLGKNDIGLDDISGISYNVGLVGSSPAGGYSNLSIVPLDFGYGVSRPRNVALLYCMKNAGPTSSPSSNVTWTNTTGDSAGNISQATTGNVGIGTVSPSQKLDVEGNTRINGTANISNANIGSVSTNQVCLGGKCRTIWSENKSKAALLGLDETQWPESIICSPPATGYSYIYFIAGRQESPAPEGIQYTSGQGSNILISPTTRNITSGAGGCNAGTSLDTLIAGGKTSL